MTAQITAPRRRAAAPSTAPFRVGKVAGYLRGRAWYLRYQEQGRRRQPRVGPDRELAIQLAAEINAQLLIGAPSAFAFEPISLPDLRSHWLENHEFVRRSSLHTIRRYRAATEHLLRFVTDRRPVRYVSDLRPSHVEEFVRYLRTLHVAPNGHPRARKRQLLDSGVRFILETCGALINYARKRRHLPPYAENPFQMLEIHRAPIDDARPIYALAPHEEVALLGACDSWQLPLFATLLMTGLRPGELVHLLLPDDLDLMDGWLHVRNKPDLGWQIKTRLGRSIPLTPPLVELLRAWVAGRVTGPLFRQRRCSAGHQPPLDGHTSAGLRQVLVDRLNSGEKQVASAGPRERLQTVARTVWRDAGALRTDWIRLEFIELMQLLGRSEITAPKTLRHTFATLLQDANVDPLIRHELMGHVPLGAGRATTTSLGMTAVYTHTRPETKRRQLEEALVHRPIWQLLEARNRQAAIMTETA